MFRRFTKSSFINTVLFVLIAVQLTACDGDGNTADILAASNTGGATTITSSPAETDDIQLTGSVGDGPVTGATVEVWNSRGRLIGTMKSDNTASFSARIRVKRSNYPLLLKVRGGIDLVSGNAPDFQMMSVMPDRYSWRININPFSTLVVRIAQSLPGGVNAKNLGVAKKTVINSLGFGLDARLIADPVRARITDTNVANLMKSSEALGEMVRRTRDAMTAAGRKINGNTVMAAIAADLHDGTLDGKGARGANPALTAVAKVVSGQVLVEALSNTLKVGGIVATNIIDQAIVTTRPGIDSKDLTPSVRITAAMLEQTRNSLAAARVMDNSAEVRGLDTVISGIAADAMSDDVRNVLPASSSRSLDNAVVLVSSAGITQIAAVNSGEAPAGDEPDVTEPPPMLSSEPTPQEPVNNAPVISGSPAGTVEAGTFYSFRPAASDANGDSLSFSITGKPAWASFNTATGRLSGTPGASAVGRYGNIVIAVSDGKDIAALPQFSVTVTAPPPVNNAPVISGSPAGTVEAGTFYSFRPAASDANGDSLSFSITGKPAWASFNTATGRLSGTPGASAVGRYGNIVIAVSDGKDIAALPQFSVTVTAPPPVNNAPVISGSPAGTVEAGTFYSFRPAASDANGDSLSFSITGKPAWASFNTATGRLSGTPGASAVGRYGNIVIAVSDGKDIAALPQFSVTVTAPPPVNNAPVISGSPAGTVEAGTFYSFRPAASDANGDSLSFSITGKPAWASFNTATGRLSGTPGASAVGRYGNIVIAVSDGKDIAALPQFSVTVTAPPPVNNAPVISGSPAGTVEAGTFYSFRPAASDANGDSLSFSITGKPAWASFNTATGRLSGTPGASAVGRYGNIVIAVSDGKDIAALPQFSVTVTAPPPVNNAPVISGSPAGTVEAGTFYSFRPAASDANGDSLSFSITGKPAWASFNTATGRLSGTPGASAVGRYGNIVIAVSDGTDVAALPVFSVTVDPAPVQTGSFSLTWTAPVTRADGLPIPLSDIGGYRIHYGVVAGNYPATVEVSDGTAQSATVDNIPAGTYHVVMTTYDINGLESVQSPAIVKTAR